MDHSQIKSIRMMESVDRLKANNIPAPHRWPNPASVGYSLFCHTHTSSFLPQSCFLRRSASSHLPQYQQRADGAREKQYSHTHIRLHKHGRSKQHPEHILPTIPVQDHKKASVVAVPSNFLSPLLSISHLVFTSITRQTPLTIHTMVPRPMHIFQRFKLRLE